jgi:hypothetical protein
MAIKQRQSRRKKTQKLNDFRESVFRDIASKFHEQHGAVACRGDFEATLEKEMGSMLVLERMRLKIHKKGKGVSNVYGATEEATFGGLFGGDRGGQLANVLLTRQLRQSAVYKVIGINPTTV